MDDPLAHVHLDLRMRETDGLGGQFEEKTAAGEQRQQGDGSQVRDEGKQGGERRGERLPASTLSTISFSAHAPR